MQKLKFFSRTNEIIYALITGNLNEHTSHVGWFLQCCAIFVLIFLTGFNNKYILIRVL